MNKLFKVFAMAVMLIMGGQAMAQTHGTMFLSASFPMKDYGDGTSFAGTALGNNDKDGGAGIGFNTGLKWDFGVGVPGLSVTLSVDGFYNGPNADMKDYYKSVQKDWESWCDNVTVTSPKYINVPAMLGLKYCLYLNSQFGIYAEAGAGGNWRFITDYTQKGTSKVLKLKNNTEYDFESALGFAWQAGLGIEVSKKLVIGCSLYDLGSADVKGELSGVAEGVNVPATNFEHGSLHPVMVLGRIGFKF